MRDILEPVLKWWASGETVRPGHGGAHVQQRAPRAGRRARRVRRRRGRRQRLRRLRRGRCLRAGHRGHGQRPAGPAALRDQRRRRLLRRPDLRRHHRHLRRAGEQGAVRRAGRGRRRGAGRRAGRDRHGDRRPGPDRRPPGHLAGRPEPAAAKGTLGSGDRLDQAVDDDARGMLAQGVTGVRRYGADGERRLDDLGVFVQSFAPPPRMLVFGAIDFAAAVARAGKFLGYRVTVCDARPVFATAARFPEADEVITEWPHRYLSRITVDERTVICVLTHDPKFDVPAARGRAAHARRLHRRDGQPPHPRRPAGPAPGGRPDRGRTGPAALADRSRPRRPHPRGDRGRHRRRAHPAPLGRLRQAADAHLGPYPPRARPPAARRPRQLAGSPARCEPATRRWP